VRGSDWWGGRKQGSIYDDGDGKKNTSRAVATGGVGRRHGILCDSAVGGRYAMFHAVVSE